MDFFNSNNNTGLHVDQGKTVFGCQLPTGGEWLPYLYSAIPLLAFFFYVQSLAKAVASPLSKIPGPFYAPWTTLHLQWGFAQGTIWSFVTRAHKTYGDVARLGPRQIWVANKDALKVILQTTDLPKVTMYAEISRDRFSPGLFGEIRPKPHAKLKRFLGPAFTVTSVDSLDNFFKACVGTLLTNYYSEINKKQKQGESTALKTDFMRDLHCLALDIMGESAFGKGFGQIDNVFDPSKISTDRDRAWSKIPDAIFSGLANRYRFVFVKRALRRLGWDIQFDWPSEMTTAIGSLIDDRAAESDEQKNSRRADILHHMLTEGNRPDTGERMNNQDIIDQMSELMLAGSETTSGTIACLFLELAENPNVREKLLKSLPAMTPDDPIIDSKTVREEPTFEYLEACIKENLRMHPIASEMGRRTIEEPMQIGEYYIPPYTIVSASYRNLHLDERYWPEPDRFWPERWLEGEARGDAPEPDMDAYYPFSAGKHSCIGKNFAYAEIRTVAANVFSRFDVKRADKKEIDFRQYITMQFVDGSWNTILTPRWIKEEA